MRTLIRAWHAYAENHSGSLVHNYHGGDAQGGVGPGHPGKAPWALGWLDWSTSSDNTNKLLILDPALRNRLGERAQAMHRARLDIVPYVKDLARLWRETCQQPRR